ncbi:hypothetical protein AB0K18_43125 [Nonomuraea sp. NPDC049421]|uniref:hypothetical protein n=1 Tax=Nonomuraea sp. NPDC049421 TaxID=3155275 RepID=UPI00343F0B5D
MAMIDCRYLGVDPHLIPPGMGPVFALVEGTTVRGLIDERQMDKQLIDMIGHVSVEVLEKLAGVVTPLGIAPDIGEFRIERRRGMPLQHRLVRPEVTGDGVTTIRVPEHSISPEVAASLQSLGTHMLSQLWVPQLLAPPAA